MSNPTLPDKVARISPGEPFSFSCYRGIKCFTDCCRSLDLVLTPYDVLRLRVATGLNSSELLNQYIIIDHEEPDGFPRFYLTMVDDGKASCVFVSSGGCSVYDHRPAACRTYPMGRAVARTGNKLEEFFVLLREQHCLGFREKPIQTVESYSKSQELEKYNYFNDMLAEIQQHEKVRAGMRLTEEQVGDYILALYDIDTFRKKIQAGSIELVPEVSAIPDDESLLRYSYAWIKHRLFHSR